MNEELSKIGVSFSITRRDLAWNLHKTIVPPLIELYSQVHRGLQHPGHDCFVFPRKWMESRRWYIPQERVSPRKIISQPYFASDQVHPLGRLLLGYPPWGRVFACSFWHHFTDEHFFVLTNTNLTFHLGSTRKWKASSQVNDVFRLYNKIESWRLMIKQQMIDVGRWIKFEFDICSCFVLNSKITVINRENWICELFIYSEQQYLLELWNHYCVSTVQGEEKYWIHC